MTGRRVKTNERAWVRVRSKALRRDNYLCQVCKKALATEVDHIIPAHQLNSVAQELQIENLQSICYPCHRLKSTRELRGGGRDTTGLVDCYYV